MLGMLLMDQTAPLLGSRYTSEGFIQQPLADTPLLRQARALEEVRAYHMVSH